MKRWLFLIALGVGGGILFRSAAMEGIYIATPSMEPALPVGTHYFVDKITLAFRAPRRGEIVLLSSPVEGDKELVKRVIGLPGETIEIRKKEVYVNDKPLSEPYAAHRRSGEALVGDNLGPLRIPEGSFFVLGDNRDESRDSATWKDPGTGEPVHFVPGDRIRGRLLNVLE
ncbi:MAG: signal peptidase I [Elusimicrobia bacterium RIFCSPLOWO2_01_FULL_64_13]|nr:MAG: signal peptidase I [Elusimicrobia bacterium RIFCSPHIGHO2_01_FULL_64_10]OGR96464.1 MAG: signal peptidase I [Elusimicrobia bacterium RIFCSPLOWO2_01_FULL_64_13]